MGRLLLIIEIEVLLAKSTAEFGGRIEGSSSINAEKILNREVKRGHERS